MEPTTIIKIDRVDDEPSSATTLNRNSRLQNLQKSSSELSLNTNPIRVQYFINENNLKSKLQSIYFKNQSSSLRIRVLRFILKLTSCGLYVTRVISDVEPVRARCFGCPLNNNTAYLQSLYLTEEQFHTNPIINWDAIYWVQRPTWLWIWQLLLCILSTFESLLLLYLNYKGNLLHQLLTLRIALELTTSLPILTSLFNNSLRNLFSPLFLNCWLAKLALETFLNDLHRSGSQSALSHHLTILSATLICLVFTSVCGVQHFQRAGHRQLDLFQSTYFVVVTFSTVGYGDYVPDIWPSQLFMVAMICVALIVLPTQFEQLAFTWMERQKLGGSYSSHRAQHERHVVVCSTTLHSDTIMDFLNEFYAHPLLQDYFVVLLSPMELDPTMRLILQVPMWAQRVIYIQGSCLKDGDLVRGRVDAAEACFILAARNYADKVAADEHTILRSWAVKDFAPSVPQYVQILRPENKLHVQFAEHIVCEDEFKYALLANNCLFPGTSTLVTLLLHTSRGQEGQLADEEWMKLYGKCSGNEVYHIKCGESKFFSGYEGCSFNYTSLQAHRKFGVCLVAVRPAILPEFYEDSLLLNPGPNHIMHKSDVCFYLSITKEEDSSLGNTSGPGIDVAGGGIDIVKRRRKKFAKASGNPGDGDGETESLATLQVPTESSTTHQQDDTTSAKIEEDECGGGNGNESREVYSKRSSAAVEVVVKGFPPVSPYIGVTPTLCHLLKEKRALCCLQLAQACPHSPTRTAYDYNWPTPTIILAADSASNAIYNFIIPLRAHFRPVLNPIILLLEKPPKLSFLDAIAHFPLVYWFHGYIDILDDLLRAGITLAENVVVVNKESSNSAEEDQLSDCNTIVAVQTMFRFFPRIKMVTELSQSSNMRFMSFRADDEYAFHLSRMEKRERERGSHISYMFRLPFAAGSVFSASMLDTLLYQAFVKDYLITFVRLLLGIDQAPGSGFLAGIHITPKEASRYSTYGRLYQTLSTTTHEIPIGIYRSTNPNQSSCHGNSPNSSYSNKKLIERAEMESMVEARMVNLGLQSKMGGGGATIGGGVKGEELRSSSVSFVIINPDTELCLVAGDFVYVVRPTSGPAPEGGGGGGGARVNVGEGGAACGRTPATMTTTKPGKKREKKSTIDRLLLKPMQSAGQLLPKPEHHEDILLRRSNSLRVGYGNKKSGGGDVCGLPMATNQILNNNEDGNSEDGESTAGSIKGTIV